MIASDGLDESVKTLFQVLMPLEQLKLHDNNINV